MSVQQSIFFILIAALSVGCHQAVSKSTTAKSGIIETVKVHKPSKDTLPFEKVVKSEAVWKKQLSEEAYYILREKGTERSFTGKYWDNKAKGIYVCAGCQLPLFSSDTKFKSGTGWPSYYQALNDHCVTEDKDDKFGWNRTEILCARCDGHLGHVFNDGPQPTGLRYCVNSASLEFKASE